MPPIDIGLDFESNFIFKINRPLSNSIYIFNPEYSVPLIGAIWGEKTVDENHQRYPDIAERPVIGFKIL